MRGQSESNLWLPSKDVYYSCNKFCNVQIFYKVFIQRFQKIISMSWIIDDSAGMICLDTTAFISTGHCHRIDYRGIVSVNVTALFSCIQYN